MDFFLPQVCLSRASMPTCQHVPGPRSLPVKCASRITTRRTFRPAGQHTPIPMLQRSSCQCQCFKVRRGWCLPVKYSCASSVPPQVASSRSSTPSSMRITLWWHRCRRLSPHPSRGRQPSFLRKTPTRVQHLLNRLGPWDE